MSSTSISLEIEIVAVPPDGLSLAIDDRSLLQASREFPIHAFLAFPPNNWNFACCTKYVSARGNQTLLIIAIRGDSIEIHSQAVCAVSSDLVITLGPPQIYLQPHTYHAEKTVTGLAFSSDAPKEQVRLAGFTLTTLRPALERTR